MAHLILIEPDRLLADTYSVGLRSVGHTIVMCASAQAAIFAADEQQPDLVIMELQLIGHSGIEFLYEFRSYTEWQQIPVVLHTQVPPAEFSGSWTMLSQELGIVGYLYKPTTSFKELLRHVNEALMAPATV